MYQRIIIPLLILVFTGVRALNIDCNGKGFLCLNTTHFYVCVDMGGGFTMTMDEVEQRCPANTFCDNRNPFECMEIITTTPKNTEASVLTLQWPSSYLSNMGIAPVTVQPNPASPIDQRPPIYTPVMQAASPPLGSSLYPSVPSATPSGTTIVKGEYVDNYLNFLPIIKRDTIDTIPGMVPSNVEGGYNSNINDITTILPLNPTISNPISTLLEPSPTDVVLSITGKSHENATIYSKPYSTMTNESKAHNFTSPNSLTTFDSMTPYIIPTDEYTYTRNSMEPNPILPIQPRTFTSPTQDSGISTAESESPTLDILSTTELNPNSTTMESISTTELSNLNSTTLGSEMTTENPLSSTLLDSPSTVENLFDSTTENPRDSSTFDLISTTKYLYNSTTEYPLKSTSFDPTMTTENVIISTTENPLSATTLDSLLFNSTIENSPISTSLDLISTTENLFNSKTENPLNSTTLDLMSTTENLFNSTTENPINSTTVDSIIFSSTIENPSNSTTLDLMSTTENLFNSTTENPLNSMTLDSLILSSTSENPPNSNPLSSTTSDSILDNSTTENPLISTTLDYVTTTLNPLNSTLPVWHFQLTINNTLNSSTPDSASTTESSILHSMSPDLIKASLSPSTDLNVKKVSKPGSLNLTEITTPVTGFETTTVKSFIIGSAPQETGSNNSTNDVLSEIPKIVNFSSNILPDVPSTPEHAISTRMIQTTEMLPFNNRVPGFVTGNIVNTGTYPSTAIPSLTLPVAIPNDSNAYNGCQRPGQYPDENSCHSYYMCHNNVRYKLICPYNMVYSPSLQKCTTAKDQCSSYNNFACSQVGRFPDTRSCYSYYDCQPNGAGFTVTRVHCPWYSSFQANNGQCVANNNACGCQQTPQMCSPQQVSMDYQGGQSTSFTFYPDNPITYNREYGVPPGFSSSINVPVNAPVAASIPYLGDRVVPADRVAIYNRENALPVDPTNTYTDKDYIREKLPVGVNYPYFGDNVVPSVDRTPTYVGNSAPGDLTSGYIRDYTPIVGNTPYVPENVVPIGGTNTYYQHIVPADQTNTYYQSNNRGEDGYTYNGDVNIAPVDSTNIKYNTANVGSIDRSNPSYIQNSVVPSNFDSGFNYYPAGEAANRLAGTNSNNGDRTRWSQPDPNNEAPAQWTPNYYGSWFN